MKSLVSTQKPFAGVLLPFAPAAALLLVLLVLPMAPSARAQTQPCPETNGVKFLNVPNTLSGWDVYDSQGVVLADDFSCNTTGPITDIHIWGSWKSDSVGTITNFWLGIYNDIPAVTNGTTVIPSHPGTNLLWEQTFDQNHFSANRYASGNEYFFDPRSSNIIGGDTLAWYYCFYPTNPFVQQGTAANPTNYWLAAHPQLFDSVNYNFGWKTCVTNYHDAAVWIPEAGGKPLTGAPWTSIYDPFNNQARVSLAFKLTTPTNNPPPCCPETNGVKWIQLPNVPTGFDVNASQVRTLADDFLCVNSGPITDIHLWGSWLSDAVDPTAVFTLTIWSDVPVLPGNTVSHPGTNLWSQTFGPGQYSMCFYTNASEQFYDVDPAGFHLLGNSTKLYYLCFFPDPANLFTQRGTSSAPTNYWLSVNAQTQTGAQFDFGWKTSITNYNDAAVWGSGTLPAGWTPMTDPASGNKVNMAFKITTSTNQPPPPPVCVETNGVKYLQLPNLDGGWDVWDSSSRPTQVTDGPWVLADDFICTNAGPVSDIHLWGSWLNDQALPGSITFWLGIYDDVGVSATNSFSHPGNLVWSQWFTPGQYAETNWSANALESFMDPGPPVNLGPDHVVWYYCFNPTNPLVQQGFPAAPKTYWLSAFAQLPAGTANVFGWKSTFNVKNDISVHAAWPGIGPTNNPGWTPTFSPPNPTAVPLDLAFKITTQTNCILPVACAGDKRVECGTTWSFDPPFVGSDPCCATNPTVTLLSITTNLLGPCQSVFSGVWKITDCVGNLAYCTQNVTVVDTTAPALNCTNLVVGCGDYSYTNPPAAYDRCCGTNVTVTLVNSQIINSNCGQTISQLWQAKDCCSNSTECTRIVHVVAGLGHNLVAPNTNATVEGNSGNSYPFNIGASDMRYQQVYAASQFGAVPPGGAYITEIVFRVDAGWGAFAATLPAVQINLSTSAKAPDGLDTTFANNVGLNDTLVYGGALPLSSAASGSPAAFDILIPLTTPFWYNPATGNLLLDVRNSGGGASAQFDAVSATNDSVSRIWGAVGSSTGGTDSLGLVTEFTLGVGTISLACPSNIVVYTCDTNPVVVTWPTNLASDTCSSVTVSSTPPSGTAFRPNTTNTVVVTAHDACGNTNSCSFTVAVRRPVLGPIAVTTIPTNKVVLTWTFGILQTTTNLFVPFTDVPSATSPYTNSTVPPPVARFYRLRCASP